MGFIDAILWRTRRAEVIQAARTGETFQAARDAAKQIDGMFSDFSMAVMDSLLAHQNLKGTTGDMLEMGVYRGRSAALIGNRLKSGEELTLVDREDLLDRRSIEPFGSAAVYLLTSTDHLRETLPNYAGRHHSFRFIHIDAGHEYRPTFNEFSIADELLAPNGIVSLDDFQNLNYSQNQAAMFKYLFTSGTDLTPFLVTDEKAYLCRRSARAGLLAWVLDVLIDEVTSRDFPNSVLARTDTDPEFDAFYLRPRNEGEQGKFYGYDTYKKFYRL